MAQNHQTQGDFTNMSSGNQGLSNTVTSSIRNNDTSSQSQQSTSRISELANPFDGILRTESGRDTYYPDGQKPSTQQSQVQRPNSSGSYGLFPNTEKRARYTAGSATAGGLAAAGAGAGLFNASEKHEDATQNDQYLHNGMEDQEPLGKVATANSSDSSTTAYGSNGQRPSRNGTKLSDTDDSDGSQMKRSVTRPEIDEE